MSGRIPKSENTNTDLELDLGYYRVEVIAKLFGVSVRRIQQITQEGIIQTVQTSEGRRYELASTVQNYTKYLSDKAHGKSKSATEADLKEQKLRAEIALKESQGELHKLRTEIAAGNYISVEEIKADYGRFFVVFKNFALSIPSKMAGRLAGMVEPAEVREIENDLQKEIKKLLNGFVSRAVVEEEKPQVDVLAPKKRGRPRKNAEK